jgi:AcrR family transcriptional regulator
MGYERATIRTIAAAAKIDPSMVMRYYGSKEELFARAASLELDVPDPSGLSVGEFCERYARGALDRWERGTNEAEATTLRAATTHPEAAKRIQETFDAQILPALTRVLRRDRRIPLRAAMFLSQGLGVMLCRYLLRLEPLASMGLEELSQALASSYEHQLTSPLAVTHPPRVSRRSSKGRRKPRA